MDIPNTITYFTFQEHSAFIPLKYLYPECFILIEGYPKMDPLGCLEHSCPVNKNCMETLVRRIKMLYDLRFPEAEQLIAYYKVRTGSIRAGIFTRDLTEPTVMTINPSALRNFQRDGVITTWIPPQEFYLTNRNDLPIIT